MNLSKRSSAVLAAVLVSVATLGAACGVDGQDNGKDATAEVVSEQDGGASSADDGDASTTTVADTSSGSIDVSGVELPRAVLYTGLEVTVDEAEAVTDPEQGPGVALSLTVHNTLGVGWQISPLGIALVDGDDTRYQATGFEDPDATEAGFTSTAEAEVISGGKIERKAFIPVEGGLDLAKATLSVAEEGILPAEVPLSGEIPERPFPLPVTVSGETATVSGLVGRPITLTLLSGELTDENAQGYRAQDGDHLVVVKYRAVGSGQGVTIGFDTVRLVVDGAPIDAVDLLGPNGDVYASEILAGGEAKDFTATYALPDDHKEVAMLGPSETDDLPDHTFAITVPPLPT